MRVQLCALRAELGVEEAVLMATVAPGHNSRRGQSSLVCFHLLYLRTPRVSTHCPLPVPLSATAKCFYLHPSSSPSSVRVSLSYLGTRVVLQQQTALWAAQRDLFALQDFSQLSLELWGCRACSILANVALVLSKTFCARDAGWHRWGQPPRLRFGESLSYMGWKSLSPTPC